MRSRSFHLEKRKSVGAALYFEEGSAAMRRQCLGSRSRGAAGLAPARAPLRLARTRPTAKGRTTTVETVARALAEEGSKALARPTDAVDWDNLSFNCDHVSKTTMFVATATQGADGEWTWKEEDLGPYRALALDPSAQVLNYGQSIFEGMKAQRTREGKIVMFRPEENAKRMTDGAGRMSMVPPPIDLFVRAVKETVRANAAFVPPYGKGSLYVRPLLLGTGAILGLGPAPSFTFLVYCSPVGAYFKGGQLTPIRLKVEENEHRAAPGGTGNTKCAGNYSPVLNVQLEAKVSPRPWALSLFISQPTMPPCHHQSPR